MTSAQDTVRRIEVAMVWRSFDRARLAAELGCSPKTLGSHLALLERYASPPMWGSRGGAVSLSAIADALGVPLESLEPGGPAGALVGVLPPAIRPAPDPAPERSDIGRLAAEAERLAGAAALAQAAYVAGLLAMQRRGAERPAEGEPSDGTD